MLSMYVWLARKPFRLSVTLYVPAVAYTCVGCICVDFTPSPNDQSNVSHSGLTTQSRGKTRKLTVSPGFGVELLPMPMAVLISSGALVHNGWSMCRLDCVAV